MRQEEDKVDEAIADNQFSLKFIWLIGVFIFCQSLFLIEKLFLG